MNTDVYVYFHSVLNKMYLYANVKNNLGPFASNVLQ